MQAQEFMLFILARGWWKVVLGSMILKGKPIVLTPAMQRKTFLLPLIPTVLIYLVRSIIRIGGAPTTEPILPILLESLLWFSVWILIPILVLLLYTINRLILFNVTGTLLLETLGECLRKYNVDYVVGEPKITKAKNTNVAQVSIVLPDLGERIKLIFSSRGRAWMGR